MPRLRRLVLSDLQRQELVRLRDTDPHPYLRERAAALLKIAQGAPAAHVARFGLLRRRAEDTVYAWFNRFERDGIAALTITKGRGRKPAFSPSVSNHDRSAGESLAHVAS